jgi:hypothetical protein
MICPECGKRMDWYIDGLIRPGASNRTCPSCEAKLELLNGNAGLIINSILLAVGLLGIWFGELPFMWLWISLLGIGCWLLLPVWTKMFARLVVSSYTREQQAKARRLAAESTASTITMAAWVLYMVVTLVVPYGQILSGFDSLDNESWDKMEQFAEMAKDRFASTRGMIELGLGILSFSWCQINVTRRMLLRRKAVASKLQQQDIIRNKGG